VLFKLPKGYLAIVLSVEISHDVLSVVVAQPQAAETLGVAAHAHNDAV
jgi:hypothetical protein